MRPLALVQCMAVDHRSTYIYVLRLLVDLARMLDIASVSTAFLFCPKVLPVLVLPDEDSYVKG